MPILNRLKKQDDNPRYVFCLCVCVCVWVRVCASVVASVREYVYLNYREHDMCLKLLNILVAHARITINHCANDLVILNKVVLHIVSETVKAVC